MHWISFASDQNIPSIFKATAHWIITEHFYSHSDREETRYQLLPLIFSLYIVVRIQSGYDKIWIVFRPSFYFYAFQFAIVWFRLINANHFLIAGVIKYIYFAVVDCVLLAVGGNHSADIISRAIAREICVIYDDFGYSEVSEKIKKAHTFFIPFEIVIFQFGRQYERTQLHCSYRTTLDSTLQAQK